MRNHIKVFIEHAQGVLEFDRARIKEVSVGSRSAPDNSKPFYGVSASYGKVGLIDADGSILHMVEQGLLKDDLPVRIYFNPPVRNVGESTQDYETRIRGYIIGSLRTERFNCSYGDDSISVDLQDDILAWNTVVFSGAENNENNTAHTFFTALTAETPQQVNATEEAINYLQSIQISDGFLLQSDLRVAWDTFCAATMASLYKNKQGEIWLTI